MLRTIYFLLLLYIPTGYAQKNLVANVNDETVFPCAFSVQRSGESETKSIHSDTEFFAGDKIIAKSKPAKNDHQKLVINLFHGENMSEYFLQYKDIFSRNGHAYLIESPTLEQSKIPFVSGIIREVLSQLEAVFFSPEEPVKAHGTTREVKPSNMLKPTIHKLRTQNAKLIAGKRPLYLSWYSNNESTTYHVKIIQEGKTESLWNKTFKGIEPEQDVIVGEFLSKQLTTGKYLIYISTDGNFQDDAKGGFTVVNEFQSEATAMANSGLPEIDREIMLAAWLLKIQNEDEWRFEAYQRVYNKQSVIAQKLEKVLHGSGKIKF